MDFLVVGNEERETRQIGTTFAKQSGTRCWFLQIHKFPHRSRVDESYLDSRTTPTLPFRCIADGSRSSIFSFLLVVDARYILLLTRPIDYDYGYFSFVERYRAFHPVRP